MKKLKFKLLNWLIHSLHIKFVGFAMDEKGDLDVIGNIPISDFERVLNLIKHIENKKDGNKSIN